MSVDDPYRALEQDTRATRAWIAAQTARTERALATRDPAASAPDRAARRSARSATRRSPANACSCCAAKASASSPRCTRSQGGQHAGRAERSIRCSSARTRRSTGSTSRPTAATWRSASRTTATSARRCAFRRRARPLLPDTIEHAKWCDWLAQRRQRLLLHALPEARRAGLRRAEPDSYFPRVFFHASATTRARRAGIPERTGSDFPCPSVERRRSLPGRDQLPRLDRVGRVPAGSRRRTRARVRARRASTRSRP